MKPILFSTEMMRAILAGRKTQTRRVIKPQPYEQGVIAASEYRYDIQTGTFAFRSDDGYVADVIKSPLKTGDILWVRETWRPIKWANKNPYVYKADWTDEELEQAKHATIDPKLGYGKNPWKPSIHMPRNAARIFLRVTDVRAERMQDITSDDAHSEGIPWVWVYEFERTEEIKNA